MIFDPGKQQSKLTLFSAKKFLQKNPRPNNVCNMLQKFDIVHIETELN